VNPEAWLCTICREETSGDGVLISHDVSMPYPYCPTMSCPGQHTDLVSAPVE
jgi:hypothetical protein